MKTRDSKFGKALVLETSELSGGYVLGFRLDEKLDEAFSEITQLWKVYMANPTFGVECTFEDEEELEKVTIPHVEDNVEIIETPGACLPSSYLTGDDSKDRDIIFSDELGLAIEEPPEGVTVEDLWKII